MRNFEFNKKRIALIDSLAEEYLNILAILYGDFFLSGIKRISDYADMTMLDAQQELHMRTVLFRAQYTRKQRALRQEYEENERALMEELKRASQ